jgi:TRAP transporter TAXI family solute receptor
LYGVGLSDNVASDNVTTGADMSSGNVFLRKLKTAFLFACGVALVGVSQPRAETEFITFGTAGVTGVYYPVGGTICRMVNRNAREHGVRCTVESTGGSIYNLNALRQNELDLAFAQSDWHFASYQGKGVFANQGAHEDLRSVFSLHSEALTVVARVDSDIDELDDLKGKRFNIGNPGSGTRSTIEELMRAKGWDKDVFALASEFKASEQAQKLCDNKIDAFAFNTGHPNGSVQEVTSTCDTKIVPVTGEVVETLIKENPYYAPATIPGGMYTGNPNDVPTYGVTATVVTTEEVDDDLIYEVVKGVFEDFDVFKRTHPILAYLDKQQMISHGLTAPLHEGARRYYEEEGLIE